MTIVYLWCIKNSKMDKYYIASLILKFLRGEMTPEEEEKLRLWRDASERNERLFVQACDEESQDEAMRKILSYDKDRAWRETRKKFGHRVRRRRLTLWSGVAASIVFIIGLVLWQPWESTEERHELARVEEILPGRPMACLISATGETYRLDSVSTQELAQVNAERDGDRVVFSDRETLDSTVVRYNRIEIPRGGEYTVVLGDGTKVYLNAETRFRFPENFSGKERLVYLSGEAYFEVAKNAKKPFIVRCDGYDVRVLGTSFNVSAYADDDVSRTTLAEGKVEIAMKGKKVQLVPGQQAAVSDGQVEVKEVDVEVYTTWMQQNFRFQSENIEEIMKKLARWYNVDVFYVNPKVKDFHFTGYLPRYANIQEVLDLLSLTTNIKFTVKDKTVMVMGK